ncbi:MAG: hydroxymethylbilane synthase [Proteobacteria bacterium]|nr:hydroxymethylbilane synthase [Pseudomonadota bacterium]
MTAVRVATRGSDLALAQAGQMAKLMAEALSVETELVVVQTSGDRLKDVPLSDIGGKGLFVKEVEEALLAGDADVAVHSAKDLPAKLPAGLVLAAFPERQDPRDALVGRRAGASLATLPRGARVGTGSARRTSQLLAERPDLEIVPLRGNVPTRLARLEERELDAVVLASAGLERLGLADRIDERIAPERMLPAVCQGTLALEVRADSALARDLADRVDHAATRAAASAERGFLTRLEGDCNVPLAAYADWLESGELRVRGLVLSQDGQRRAASERVGAAGEAEALGRELADAVRRAGGEAILSELREGTA